jgi:hypothetical protein
MLVIPRTKILQDQKVFSLYNFNTKLDMQKWYVISEMKYVDGETEGHDP